MADQYITCPKCNNKIPLSKALTGQIEDKLRKDFETQIKKRERELAANYQEQLANVTKQAEKKAKASSATVLADLQQQIQEKDIELAQAQKQELNLRKRQRDLEKREREMELEVARKLDQERQKVEREVTDRLAEASQFKDQEKDKQLADLRKQIEDLKRKAEQGSQQAQGEVAEVGLEELLRLTFPCDRVEPVPKGIKGVDIVQHVYVASGQCCGTIVWETKNTKSWSDGWVTKLKDDQRTLKAEIAVLVSTVLPKDISHFGSIDGVWITDFSTAMGVSTALRANLAQVAMTKLASEGRSGKMELLYSYLSGIEFKQRVEAIIDAFVSMEEDLEREKRAMEAMWSRRGKQLEHVIQGVSGMYGDMQGIVGAMLPRIERLELPTPSEEEMAE